jgi:hypothetical protein
MSTTENDLQHQGYRIICAHVTQITLGGVRIVAKYLIILKAKNMLPRFEEEHLKKFKQGVEAALKKGSIEGAYAKVGGGLVFVVNFPGNAELTLELRKHQIVDAEVIPLVPLTSLLEAHIDFRKTGVRKV